ncbi:MAG TPA: segregation/condensation protein A [Methanomicrobiales archaeon]|nr:segregation/condensation protein A [Methanomicrobiales archaeon]
MGEAPAGPSGVTTPEEEPVEILVGLAERGEIDPWNIDILEVTDRFLGELDRLRQLDLRISGRTLFYAATLLRLKSEFLVEPEEGPEEEDLFEEEPEGFDIHEYLGPIERLEREIRRRIERKNLRTRPVTLYELIRMLRTAEREEHRRRRTRTVTPEFIPETEDVVSVAHDEGYQETAGDVWKRWEDLCSSKEQITLGELCQTLDRRIADVYIPLLFLNLDGKLEISQETFFEEVFIRKVPEGMQEKVEGTTPEEAPGSVPEDGGKRKKRKKEAE